MKLKKFGHLLVQKISSNNTIDPADGVEPIDNMKFTNKFSGTVIIKEKNKVV